MSVVKLKESIERSGSVTVVKTEIIRDALAHIEAVEAELQSVSKPDADLVGEIEDQRAIIEALKSEVAFTIEKLDEATRGATSTATALILDWAKAYTEGEGRNEKETALLDFANSRDNA